MKPPPTSSRRDAHQRSLYRAPRVGGLEPQKARTYQAVAPQNGPTGTRRSGPPSNSRSPTRAAVAGRGAGGGRGRRPRCGTGADRPPPGRGRRTHCTTGPAPGRRGPAPRVAPERRPPPGRGSPRRRGPTNPLQYPPPDQHDPRREASGAAGARSRASRRDPSLPSYRPAPSAAPHRSPALSRRRCCSSANTDPNSCVRPPYAAGPVRRVKCSGASRSCITAALCGTRRTWGRPARHAGGCDAGLLPAASPEPSRGALRWLQAGPASERLRGLQPDGGRRRRRYGAPRRAPGACRAPEAKLVVSDQGRRI